MAAEFKILFYDPIPFRVSEHLSLGRNPSVHTYYTSTCVIANCVLKLLPNTVCIHFARHVPQL